MQKAKIRFMPYDSIMKRPIFQSSRRGEKRLPAKMGERERKGAFLLFRRGVSASNPIISVISYLINKTI
jgi:hypothetical protein